MGGRPEIDPQALEPLQLEVLASVAEGEGIESTVRGIGDLFPNERLLLAQRLVACASQRDLDPRVFTDLPTTRADLRVALSALAGALQLGDSQSPAASPRPAQAVWLLESPGKETVLGEMYPVPEKPAVAEPASVELERGYRTKSEREAVALLLSIPHPLHPVIWELIQKRDSAGRRQHRLGDVLDAVLALTLENPLVGDGEMSGDERRELRELNDRIAELRPKRWHGSPTWVERQLVAELQNAWRSHLENREPSLTGRTVLGDPFGEGGPSPADLF